jgi:CBS domain-containing protein
MYEFLEYQVADVMTYRPVTVTRRTPLAEVEQIFARRDFNCLPVCEDGVLLGIVTKLDLLRAFAFTSHLVPPYHEIMHWPTERIMTPNPATVRPDAPVTRVLQLMVEMRYRALPVVIGALLIGVVARQDVVRALDRAAAGQGPRRVAAVGERDHERAHLHP